MDKVLNIDDEVLIFRYFGKQLDYEHFLKGKITNSKMSDDLSHHGSPWYVRYYTVLGEDGVEYFGQYMHSTLNDYLFMTKDDYLDYLKRKVAYNQDRIKEIKGQNKKIQNIIDNLQIKESNNDKTQLIKKKKIGVM